MNNKISDRIIKAVASLFCLICGVVTIILGNTKWKEYSWTNTFGILICIVSFMVLALNILAIVAAKKMSRLNDLPDGEVSPVNLANVLKGIDVVNVNTPHEQYARNLVDLGIFALKRANLYRSAEQFEFSFDNPRCLTVTDVHGNEYELDLDLYIHHDDQKMSNKLCENDALIGEPDFDREYVIEEVLDRSRRLLQDNIKHE